MCVALALGPASGCLLVGYDPVGSAPSSTASGTDGGGSGIDGGDAALHVVDASDGTNTDMTTPVDAGADGHAAADAAADADTDTDTCSNPESWWGTGSNHRRKLTLGSAAPLNNDVNNAPILIRLDDAANIDFDKISPGGADIRFTDAASNELKYEIENWDDANQVGEIWVNVPVVLASSDTSIFMYYDNPLASYDQLPADESAVWDSSFIVVHHLNETDIDGGFDDIKDSTANGNDGTTSGLDPSDRVGAAVAGGFRFNDDDFDNSIRLGNNDTFDPTASFTIEAWLKPYSAPVASSHYTFFSRRAPNTPGSFSAAVGSWAGTDTVLTVATYTDSWNSSYSTGELPINEWSYVAVVYGDSSTIDFYIDGAFDSSDTYTKPTSTTGLQQLIGIAQLTDPLFDFQGEIDELRISTGDRTADWIKLQNLSMSDTLVTFECEETD